MKLKIQKDRNFFLFWKMMTSYKYQGFNIILAHAREEAKNEARSKIFIYDLTTEVHLGDLCSPCRKHQYQILL